MSQVHKTLYLERTHSNFATLLLSFIIIIMDLDGEQLPPQGGQGQGQQQHQGQPQPPGQAAGQVLLPQQQEIPTLMVRLANMFQQMMNNNEALLDLQRQQRAHHVERTRVPHGLNCPQWGADPQKDTTWLGHIQAFDSYVRLTQMTEVVAKEMLVNSIKGVKSNQILGYGPNFRGWEALTYDELKNELSQIFRPAAELSLAKAHYKARKQQPKESLQAYSSAKKSLFLQAYPDTEANTSEDLIDDFISGIANPDVVRTVLNRGPFGTFVEVLTVAMRALGAERELVLLGHKKDTIGLETAMAGTPSYADRQIQSGYRHEPMDVNAIMAEEEYWDDEEEGLTEEQVAQYDLQHDDEYICAMTSPTGEFKGSCFRCGVHGHPAKKCTNPRVAGANRGFRGKGKFSARGRGRTNRGRNWSTRGASRDKKGRYTPGARTGFKKRSGVFELTEGEDPLDPVEEELEQEETEKGENEDFGPGEA